MLGRNGRISRWLGSAAIIIGSLLSLPAESQPQEIQELMKIQERALANARELSGSSLPDAKSWGEGWKKAWELPGSVPAACKSEDEYWQNTIKNLGGAGLTQADAEKVLSVFTQGFAQQGMTQRDGMIQALVSLRNADAPAAQQILAEWETYSAGLKLAGSTDRSNRADAYKQLLQLSAAPYKDFTDAQLRNTYLREATLLKKRTFMSFYKCNNWDALAKVRSDREIKENNLWIGTVDVKLMFADESRIAELQDLPAAEVSNLQNRLQAAVQGVIAGVQPMLKQQLDKVLKECEERAKANPDDLDARRTAQQAQDEYNAAIAAVGQTKAEVAMKQFGDNSYVIRVIGVNPDVAGDKAGLFIGWIRKGHVMSQVSVKGNAPEEELSKAMDHFLSELDAKLASYDSSLAGMMKIAPAGAIATPTNPPTVGSTSGASKKSKPPLGHKDPSDPGTGKASDADLGSATGMPTGPKDSTSSQAGRGTPGTITSPPVVTNVDPPEYQQAQDAYNSGDVEGSKRLVEQALQKNPGHVSSLMMRGSLRNIESDLAGALADFKRASEVEPGNANARRYHALFELLAGDAVVAAKEADAAIQLSNGDVETYLLRAQAAMAMDKPDEAKPYFEKVLQLRPNRAAELYAEAGTALNTKRYMVANLQFQTVLWLDPNQYSAHFGRGAALAGLGRNKQAVASYQRYLKFDATSAYARQARDAIKALKTN